jgi:hypothetical protein
MILRRIGDLLEREAACMKIKCKLIVAVIALELLSSAARPSAAQASPVVSKQIEWSAGDSVRARKFEFGGVVVLLSAVSSKDTEAGSDNVKIVISARGTDSATFFASNASGPGATIQFAELDPENNLPEVLVSTSSGGVHCCYLTMAFYSDGNSWVSASEARVMDGAASLAQDVNHDGKAEVAERDTEFLYVFASYAGSFSPSRLFQLSRGEWADVTQDKSFRSFHQVSDATYRGYCGKTVQKEDEVNGFWAGYVARETLAGRRQRAWNIMLKCYDKKSNWGLCGTPGDADCTERVQEFPEALRDFLKSRGYW